MGSPVEVEAEPHDVGLSGGRLGRVDALIRRYVDSGRLAGAMVAVTRDSKVVHVFEHGDRDLASAAPMSQDTIVRLYSMTKPVTSVAAMMLHEEGAFDLLDPVSDFIPAFADSRVWVGGNRQEPVTAPLREPLLIWHLLTHTSGLTYGFALDHSVDAMYRRAGYGLGAPEGMDRSKACDFFAGLPLLFEPGTEWNYSVSTDVLGRLVEVASGMPLDTFFAERIFRPLGMVETGFFVQPDQYARLASLYVPESGTRQARVLAVQKERETSSPALLSGGGGLYGTAADYLRFTKMLVNDGELDGTRLLGRKTLQLMTSNHLPGGANMADVARRSLPDLIQPGTGFGLGFAVVTDVAKSKVPGSAGTFFWGGAASTFFFVDPVEKITMVFLTQLLPSSTYPLRRQLRQLVMQSVID